MPCKCVNDFFKSNILIVNITLFLKLLTILSTRSRSASFLNMLKKVVTDSVCCYFHYKFQIIECFVTSKFKDVHLNGPNFYLDYNKGYTFREIISKSSVWMLPVSANMDETYFVCKLFYTITLLKHVKKFYLFGLRLTLIIYNACSSLIDGNHSYLEIKPKHQMKSKVLILDACLAFDFFFWLFYF